MTRKKPLIFIVDDVPENIQIAISHLKELDCDFAYATSGEQALERIGATRPQLILMDVMMPGMSGFQAVEELAKNAATCSIPVIFLTARAESEDVVRGFKLGGDDYVTKPFKGVELRSRVRNHLELHAYRSNLERLVDEPDRGAFRRALEAGRARFQPALEAVRGSQRGVSATLAREPFDPAALRAAMAESRQRWAAFSMLYEDSLAEGLSALSPEGRRRIAEDMARQDRHRRRDGQD